METITLANSNQDVLNNSLKVSAAEASQGAQRKMIVKSLLAVMALSLTVACGEKKDGVQVQTGRTAVPGAPGTFNNSTGGVTGSVQLSNGTVIAGIVYADPSYQSAFQSAVEKYLEPMLSPDAVGTVSAVGQNGTGIFIGGSIQVSQIGMQANGLAGQSSASVVPGGSITTLIYDDYAYQPSQTGGTSISAIARQLNIESGSVAGSQARVVFADGLGRVELVGQMSNGRFTGSFFFKNNGMVETGSLGTFSIPTCQIFRCQ